MGFVSLSVSTYYENVSRSEKTENGAQVEVTEKKSGGRPIRGYSLTDTGRRVCDGQIKEWLCGLIVGDGFPYGYRKLTVCLREDYGLKINHKPVKTPNMIAHIEAFHSILEDECYTRHEFGSFGEAYAIVAEYIRYYNHRRRHGAIGFMSPEAFHEAFIRDAVPARVCVA